MNRQTFAAFLLLAMAATMAPVTIAAEIPIRPSGDGWPPVIAMWGWKNETLAPGGYKPFLDAVAAHAPYTLLSTTMRVSKGEVTDPFIHDRAGEAVRYANALGIKIALDLDVRLARRAFHKRYPDELQEELVLKIQDMPPSGEATVAFEGRDLTDHMTGGTIPYQCLATRLM